MLVLKNSSERMNQNAEADTTRSDTEAIATPNIPITEKCLIERERGALFYHWA